jgi:hypothetical protein
MTDSWDSSDGTDGFMALDAGTGRNGFQKSGLLAALDPRKGNVLKTVSTMGNTTGIAVVDGSVYSAGYIDTKLVIKYGVGK